jgi:hypothetical protein
VISAVRNWAGNVERGATCVHRPVTLEHDREIVGSTPGVRYGHLAEAVAVEGLALGAVTRLTLDVEPALEVGQRLFEGLDWEPLFAGLDAITASG